MPPRPPTAGSSPTAEIEVAETLVRALLAEQHADLADLPISEIGSGWDNSMWRLGGNLLVRLPRRAVAAGLAANEQRWLPELARLVPLPIPAPVRIGQPSGIYPWPWSVVPWLEGRPGDQAPLTDPDDAARRLGLFLRALHRPAPADAPHNPFRGVPLSHRSDTFEDRLASLCDEVDADAIRPVWDRAVAASPWPGPPVWIHGDLHPANTLVGAGTLAAVIDFGDVCAGDPATDFAAAFMLLPAAADPTFRSAYGGADPHLERRALGWAVLFGLMLLQIGLTDRPSYAVVARATLARAVRCGGQR